MPKESLPLKFGLAATGQFNSSEALIGHVIAVVERPSETEVDLQIFREQMIDDNVVSSCSDTEFDVVEVQIGAGGRLLKASLLKGDSNTPVSVSEEYLEAYLNSHLMAERPVLRATGRFIVPLQLGDWQDGAQKDSDDTYRIWKEWLSHASADTEATGISFAKSKTGKNYYLPCPPSGILRQIAT